jgi:ubiquinone/menaquinone biosynthesis C-methylase UbiE
MLDNPEYDYMGQRIPLFQEPIAEKDAVEQYDKGAKCYMVPEYKYFVHKILSRGIRTGKVLDIGTGSGLLALELCKAKNTDFDIVAIDVSENMLMKAEENARQVKQGDRIKFLEANGAALPFPDNSFDLVISYASLHHWLDPVVVFNEAERVVKDTGRIIIRDNIRVYQDPFWKSVVWIASRFMNKRHRENWPHAIMASYTIPETREILQRSRLRNYQVGRDFVMIDVYVESPGA